MGQYSDALRDKNTVLKPFIKDFPSLASGMFKAYSGKACSVCVKPSYS